MNFNHDTLTHIFKFPTPASESEMASLKDYLPSSSESESVVVNYCLNYANCQNGLDRNEIEQFWIRHD